MIKIKDINGQQIQEKNKTDFVEFRVMENKYEEGKIIINKNSVIYIDIDRCTFVLTNDCIFKVCETQQEIREKLGL